MENGVCWDSSWLKLLGLSVEKAFFPPPREKVERKGEIGDRVPRRGA
jgi:hypothetical protein